MLGLASNLVKGGASLLTFVKDNLKLYLDFKKNRSDTLAFPSDGSTSFDASTEKITVGQSNSIITGNEVTLSCWFKSEAYNSERGYLLQNQKGAGSTNITLQIHGNDGTASSGYIGGLVWDGSSSHSWTTVDGSVDDGKWHHVAFTSTATTQKVYLDGVLKVTETNTFANSASTDATIIGNDGSDNYPFNGKMANVAIWNRVLSPEEVQSVMNKSYSQLGSVEKTSLVSWWALDSVDATGRMDTPAVGTGAITTSFPTNIYLNSHGTTEYTEVMANNGSLATQGAWTIHSGGTDSAFADTGVYSEGALKAKNTIITKVAVNSTNASVLEAFIVGQLYKFEITYTRVDGQHAQSWYVGINESYGGVNDLIFKEGYWNNDDDGAPEKTITGYFIHQASKNFLWVRVPTSSVEIHIKSISIKKITNNAGGGGISITNNNNHYDATLTQGATTTTLVYGGNAPVLPRAIDIAESFADAIGNGSALFNGSSDYVSVGDNNKLSFGNGSVDEPFSISAWVNPTDTANFTIISKGVYNADAEYIFWINGSDKLSLELYDESVSNTYELALYNTALTSYQGSWFHVCATYNGVGGTSANGGIKLYVNGINVATTLLGGGTYVAMENLAGEGRIGRYNTAYADGSISQLGVWKGVLSQEMVQSVMESNSYAKIPASVKSTLGSELFGDPSFDDASYWTIYNGTGTIDVNTTNAGKLTVINAHEKRVQRASVLTVGKLYKITFVIDSYTDGRIRGLYDSDITFSPTGAGTYSRYFVASNVTFLIHIDKFSPNNSTTGADMTLTDISIKEVTNDIVAYYPLDEAKHLAPSGSPVFGAVEDATTGENLGAELFTGWINTDCETFNYNSSTKEVTATTNGSNQEIHTSFSTESGKVYRIEFTTGANYSNTVYLRGIVNDTSLEGYSSSPQINRAYFGTENTYVFYIKATATGTKYIGFRGGSGLTIHITNFSVKKADSNMGLLK